MIVVGPSAVHVTSMYDLVVVSLLMQNFLRILVDVEFYFLLISCTSELYLVSFSGLNRVDLENWRRSYGDKVSEMEVRQRHLWYLTDGKIKDTFKFKNNFINCSRIFYLGNIAKSCSFIHL